MSWITLDEARANLQMWLEAEKAVATGQSYRIGARQLNRVDLSKIAERIKYWRNEVAKLESGRKGGGMKVMRAVPRDL